MFSLWKIIIVLNIIPFYVDCQFDSQYLGNYLTFDQYNKLELGCDTTICLRDAQRLRLAATQNKTIEPCDDFKEFSMGQFIKLRAPDDRLQTVGFSNDLNALDWERYRKVLAAKIKDDDIRPSKIAKNYYRKCVNSDYSRKNGTAEILQYVRSLGGAPFLNASWDESDFNIIELFEKESREAVNYFLYHDTGRCPHPQNKTEDIFCLKSFSPFTFSQEVIDGIAYLFEGITYNKTMFKIIAEKSNDLLTQQANMFSQTEANPVTFTISELNNYTNNAFDWLLIINAQLTSELQLTNESEILINNPELILKLLELIKDTPKSTLADVFAFQFLYKYRPLFIVYSGGAHQQSNYGSKISKQRWWQCADFLYYTYGPALQVLYAAKYVSLETQLSVINFTKEAIEDFMTSAKTMNNFSQIVEQDLTQKLNKIEFLIGFPNESFDNEKIEELYKELDLNGTEGSVETYLKIYKYNHKINNHPLSNWKKKLSDRSSEFSVKYYIDDNIVYIPSLRILYPYYHPKRPRFFNTATVFKDIVNELNAVVKKYLSTHWNTQFEHDNEYNLAYNNYVNWEKTGGKELQLPGFFLTNRQMYWIALIHVKFYKYDPEYLKYPLDIFKIKHMHILYKAFRNFRDAFNCSELTTNEENIFEILKENSLINEKMFGTNIYYL